jgi:hypothetical protein
MVRSVLHGLVERFDVRPDVRQPMSPALSHPSGIALDQADGVVALADRLAERLLGDLRTKLGGRHIDHARRVAARCGPAADERVRAAALLHDVVEKCGITPCELRELMPHDGVIDLVTLLTHAAGEPELDYLARCAADPDAFHLKRLDLLDKLLADDNTVPLSEQRRIMRRSIARLDLLDRLRRHEGHPPSGGGGPPEHE